MAEAEEPEMFSLIDLLALNIEEASSLIAATYKDNPEFIVDKAIEKMRLFNPAVSISITAGLKGSWSWDGEKVSHVPIFPVEVKSSAGAGDAHLAGVIAGLTAGLEIHQAQVIGNLAGAFSATSQHTIHPEMDVKKLKEFALTYPDTLAHDLLNRL
jgi:ribokinase